MANLVSEEPRGILNPRAGEKKFQLVRYVPSEELKFFVEHYWIISWDLRGQDPYLSENLPYPTVHLVIQKESSGIVGVVTGKFSYLVKDRGRVFGIKYRPGAFYPFVRRPISMLTDKTIGLADAFGADGCALEAAILSLEDPGEMIDVAEQFIRARLPDRDRNITTINTVIEAIMADRMIIKVDDIVEQLKLNKRWLQRLFNRYVGVSPKWVIKRYRLHEAAEKVAHGQAIDWPALALNLGYFDQTHFIKDFKAIVGQTPADYAKQIG